MFIYTSWQVQQMIDEALAKLKEKIDSEKLEVAELIKAEVSAAIAPLMAEIETLKAAVADAPDLVDIVAKIEAATKDVDSIVVAKVQEIKDSTPMPESAEPVV